MLARCMLRMHAQRPPISTLKRFSSLTSFQKPMQLDPLETFKPNKQHYSLIALLTATASAVLIFDIYYLTYLKESPLPPLEEYKFNSYSLLSKQQVSHDTMLLRFGANIPDFKDIPVPSHVIVKDSTCEIGREYTPIAYSRQTFDLLVKKYPNGHFGNYLHNLDEKDTIEMRGPILSFPYERNMVEEISLLAAGSGITPMYQLIKRILRDPDDGTRISLVYANKTLEDILLKSELDVLSNSQPDRFKPGKEWTGERGRVGERLLKDVVGKDALVLVCGPDGFVRHVAGEKVSSNNQGELRGVLKQMGFRRENVFKF